MPNFGKPKTKPEPTPAPKPEPKPSPPSHEIHTDGTYSNHKSVAGTAAQPRVKVVVGQQVAFDGPYRGSGFVYEIRDGGFWTRPRIDFAPDLSKCHFWTWEYAAQYMRGVV